MNRIGKKADEIEMAWTLTVVPGEDDDGGASDGELRGAGFGKISDSFAYDDDGEFLNACDSIVKSAKGGVAGTIPAPGGIDNNAYCLLCGDPTYYGCEVWPFCNECDDSKFDDSVTAAYGTWTLKYNSKVARVLSTKDPRISQAYKFPTAIAADLVAAGE
mgnify:CR=1 FL=1